MCLVDVQCKENGDAEFRKTLSCIFSFELFMFNDGRERNTYACHPHHQIRCYEGTPENSQAMHEMHIEQIQYLEARIPEVFISVSQCKKSLGSHSDKTKSGSYLFWQKLFEPGICARRKRKQQHSRSSLKI